MVRLNAINKSYREHHILKNVDLHIEPGEFVAIMGPSGSGKSTLMNILGCLDTADTGEYFINGTSIETMSEPELADIRNRKIGFVFQAFNLLPRLTVLENVLLPVNFGHEHKADYVARAYELLAAVGLQGKENSYPHQLSGGQVQRVAIARSLIMKPDIILADEPTGNLDTKSSQEVMKILTKLNKQGNTVIIVTHEPDIAAFCDRTITLRDGKVQ